MQEPENWPTQSDALVPLARAELDWGSGQQEVHVVASQVRRNLTTDLPAQVRGGAGISVAQGTLTLGPTEETEVDPVTPLGVARSTQNDTSIGRMVRLPDSIPSRIQPDDVALILATTNEPDPLPARLHLNGGGDRASNSTNPAPDVTGDIDIRMAFTVDSWIYPVGIDGEILASKYNATGDQRSWALLTLEGGGIEFIWSTNGVNQFIMAENGLGFDERTVAIRFTLDVNNGSGQRVGRFYHKPNIRNEIDIVDITSNEGWVQFGTDQVQAGTTSIFDSTALLTVGSLHGGTAFANFPSYTGDIYAFELRAGINGTVRASPDFRAASEAPFTDSVGRVWGLGGTAALVTPEPPLPDLQITPRGQKVMNYVAGEGWQLHAYALRITEEDLDGGLPLIGAQQADGSAINSLIVATYRNVDWSEDGPALFFGGSAVTTPATGIPVPDVNVNRPGLWIQVVTDLQLFDTVSETFWPDFTPPPGVIHQITAPGTNSASEDNTGSIALGYRYVGAGEHPGDVWVSGVTGTRDRAVMSIVVGARKKHLLQPTDIPGHWSPWRPNQPARRTNQPVEVQHGFGVYETVQAGAPAIRSLSFEDNTVTFLNTIQVPAPAGIEEGDVLIAQVGAGFGDSFDLSVTDPAGLILTATTGLYASTPDNPALDITGDIDLRADITPFDWTPATEMGLVGKWTFTSNQRSYLLALQTSGAIRLYWSVDGTATLNATSVPLPSSVRFGRRTVRVTLDVDDGGGNRVARFYYADGTTGPWILFDTVTVVGTTSIFSGTGNLEVGSWNVGALGNFRGLIHAVRVWNGISNPILVANPQFTGQTTGATSFTDSAGRIWTVHGGALVVSGEPTGTSWQRIATADRSNNHAAVFWKRAGATEPPVYIAASTSATASTYATIIAVMSARQALVDARGMLTTNNTIDTDFQLTPTSSLRGPGIDIRFLNLLADNVGVTNPTGWDTILHDGTVADFNYTVHAAARQFRAPVTSTGEQRFDLDQLVTESISFTINVANEDINYETLVPKLKGTIVRASSSTANPILDLELVDLSTRMQYPYSLDAIYNDLTDNTNSLINDYGPNLNPIWVIDNLLRRGGFNQLIPVQANCIFSASLMGSAQPEVYTRRQFFGTVAAEVPFTARNFATDGMAGFVPSSFAPLAANDLDAMWDFAEPGFAPNPVGGTGSKQYAIYFYIDYESSTPGSTLTIEFRGTVGIINAGNVRFELDVDTRTAQVFDGATPETTFGVPNSGLVALRMGFNPFGAGTRFSFSVFQDGTLIGTSNNNDFTEEQDLEWRMVVRTNGAVVGGVQVTRDTRTDVPDVFNHEPTADLAPSLGALTGTPAIVNQTAWQVATDIVSAEQGALWIDETGKAVFRNRDQLHGIGITPYDITARDSITELVWEESWDQVYGEVEVSYQPVIADASRVFVVWRAEGVERIGGLETTRIRVVNLSQSVLGATTKFTMNTALDGSGSSGTLGVYVVFDRLIDSNTYEFQIRNNSSAPRWFVDTNGSPTLRVEANVAVILGSVEVVDSVASSESTKVLTISPNPWRQQEGAAQALASTLASDVSDPLPLLTQVNVKPDPRIQLADVVRVHDPVATQISQRAVVTGITEAFTAGNATMQLEIRPLTTQWDDFDAAWAAAVIPTWDQFDATWAAATWDDFDEDQTRTEAP